MNFEVIATDPFKRKLKRLAKKYRSLKDDLAPLFDDLEINPEQGKSLGHNCFKIRLAIASKGKGTSGGARVITYVKVVNQRVFLLDIYDKSEQDSITEKELKWLIDMLSDAE